MPLQIRRGSAAERNSISSPLAVGELLYVTDQGKLYIGDGTLLTDSTDVQGNPGQGGKGLIITGFTSSEAKDAAAQIFLDGSHSGVSFSYNSSTKEISATVNLSDYDGVLKASAFNGSLVADDSTELVNAVDGIFNLNGTISDNVVPVTTNTVDLGTSSTRFKSAYFDSTGTISLGSAVIGTSGSAITLPAGTTIGGETIGWFLGTDDSTNTLVENGDTISIIGDNQNITTSVNEEGHIVISSNVETIVVTPQAGESENHYITFFPSFSGSGSLKADGSLRYIPSTTTLDFPEGSVIALSLSAPDVITTDIRASTMSSGPGVLTMWSEFDSGGTDQFLVSVGDPTDVSKSSRFQVTSSTYFGSTVSLAQFNQHHSTADALNVQFSRSRGSSVSPAAVQNGDDLIDLAFLGHDGSAYLTRAAISATVNGTVSTGVIPVKIELSTSVNGSGAPTAAVTIDQRHNTTLDGALKFKVYADPTARDAALPSGVVEAGMVVFLTDNSGAGGSPKLQINTDGTTSGWINLH